MREGYDMTHFTEQSPPAGFWKKWRGRLIILGVAGTVAYALWPVHNTATAPTSDQPLLLSSVDVTRVTRESAGHDVFFTGTLMPWQQATLNAHFSGELVAINVKAGDTVAEGDVLAQLDTRIIESQYQQALAALQARRLEAAQARQKLDQIKKLGAKGFSSTAERDAASRQLDIHLAQVESAEAALDQIRKQKEDAVIRAPFDGSIAQRFADPGEVVPAGAPLLKLVDMHRLELEALVSSTDIALVTTQQQVSFSVDSTDNLTYQGQVVRINPEARQDNRRVPVYIEVDNRLANLPAGIFVQGRILDANPVSGLALPTSALQQTATGWQVFVVNNNHLEAKNVSRLFDNLASEQSIINGAVNNNDLVVILPTSSLADKQPVEFMDEG